MYLQQMYNQTGKHKVQNSHSIRYVMNNLGDARIYEFFSNEGEVIFSFYLGRDELSDMLFCKPLKDCERLYFRMFAGPQNMPLDYKEYLKLLGKKPSSVEESFVSEVMDEFDITIDREDVGLIVDKINKWLAIKNMV